MSKPKRKPQGKANRNADLTDSPRDQEKLKNEEATLDLPDVKDIPGQEHVHVPRPGEFADTTISSADEEGDNVWANDEVTDDGSTVTDIERELCDDGAKEDCSNEDIGEEDEENNPYSLGGDDNSVNEERSGT